MKLEKEKKKKINSIEIEKTKERNISLEEQNKKLIIKNEDLKKKLMNILQKFGSMIKLMKNIKKWWRNIGLY